MRLITRQFFFSTALFLAVSSSARGEPVVGRAYAINMVDVDQHKISTADGHVTLLVIASTLDGDKARSVGDRTPDRCVIDSRYRLITLLRFKNKHSAPARMLINTMVRRRLESEAQRLVPRYQANKITRVPRNDAIAVTDYDGLIGAQLGIAADSIAFQVLLLDRQGELLRRWTDVPSAKELEAALPRLD